MAEIRFDGQPATWLRVFPWLRLFRVFRIACDPKKIFFGAIGALLMSLGWWVITSWVISTPNAQTIDLAGSELDPANHMLHVAREMPWDGARVGSDQRVIFQSPLTRHRVDVDPFRSLRLALYPIARLCLPVSVMLSPRGYVLIGCLLYLWCVIVWSVFGGAITRIAAMQIAREGSSVGPVEAIRFVISRFMNYLLPPILPIAGVLLIVLFVTALTLLAHIPVLDVVVGFLWFIPLLAGMVVAFAFLLTALGWPMFCPAVSTEATEAFDALSRAFSYVFTRPWSFVCYWLITIFCSAVMMTFAVTLGYWMVSFTHLAASLALGQESARQLFAWAPTTGGWQAEFGLPAGETVTGVRLLAARMVGGWLHLVQLLIVGYLYSYFWCSATTIYFLLRKEVDESEFEDVFLEEVEDEPFPTLTPATTLGTPPEPPGPPNPLNIIDRPSMPNNPPAGNN